MNRLIWTWTARLALGVALLACASAWAQTRGSAKSGEHETLIDRIVAVVNNEAITQYQLSERVAEALRELHSRGIPAPAPDVLRKQVLERMVMERIQLQLAHQTGLRVDDLQLDDAVSRIAQRNHMSLTEFRHRLEDDGMSFAKFRERVRVEMILARLREREVDSKIRVSESEIDNFIAEHKGNKTPSVEYHLSHILVRVPEQASPEQIAEKRERAEEAVRRIKAGMKFAQAAVTYSDDADALTGGDMGWRTRDRLPELFVKVAARMKPGEISPVLRSPAGFHILRLDGKRAAKPVMVMQSHIRHILIRTGENVSDAEARRKLLRLRDRIMHGASFAELARLNSDDASASRGGDLGWVSPGDTVPAFERAANALKVMQISQPVKTQFGWHLIQVLGRRKVDASSERARMDALRTLRERKSDEAYQEWLRQLRDTAFVQYRLDDK